MNQSRRTFSQARNLWALLLVIALAPLAACDSDDNPMAPSNPLTGTWTGTIDDNTGGMGTARVTLNQSGSTLTGTWATSLPGSDNGGSLTGSVNGSALSIVLDTSDPTSCPFNLTATVNGNRMTGTYAAFNCSIVVTGSLDLTKE